MNYKSNKKMDIGDFGFLIVALIVFVVNFFVKAQKNKLQSEKPVPPELSEPWEVEETLPPIFQSPFNRENKTEVIKKKTSRPLPSIQESYESKRLRLQTEEGVSSLSESLFKEDEMESITYNDSGVKEKSYTDDLFHGNITEELKKAIIYSEILHRKYE